MAAGIGSLVERSVVAYEVLRLAGAAYIVYLGVQAIRHRRELSTVLDVTATRSSRHIVREGFIVGITNPKAIVFFTAVLPQFVDPDGAAVPMQMVLLGLISVTVAFVSDSALGRPRRHRSRLALRRAPPPRAPRRRRRADDDRPRRPPRRHRPEGLTARLSRQEQPVAAVRRVATGPQGGPRRSQRLPAMSTKTATRP